MVRCHKEGIRKIAIGSKQSSGAVGLALGCTPGANIYNVHVKLSLLKVEERLTSSLLVFVKGLVESTELSV